MTTIEKLNKIKDSKSAIKSAIIAKGVEVGDKFEDYADAIESIESGGGSDDTLGIAMIERSATAIEIPNGITKIGVDAFRDWTTLISVTIPNSVIEIGQSAFDYCTSLTSIIIPSSVTSISGYAFRDCKKLSSMSLLGDITIINNSFCKGCTSLTSIILPSSVTKIDNYAFQSCTALVSITCNSSTPPSLSSNAFSGCTALTHIYVPADSVTAYQEATNWSNYSSIISAIEE